MNKSSLNRILRSQLLEVARKAIHAGVEGRRYEVGLNGLAGELLVCRASFVTLKLRQRLRGCIGSLQAWRPLVVDVAENAYAAAFHDPRFPPVTALEEPELHLHLSLLTPSTAMNFSSESNLLSQLRPGVDGLILQEGRFRSTFLPSVWDELPTADLFLRQLKRKAGLAADYWSDTIVFLRYETESIDDEEEEWR